MENQSAASAPVVLTEPNPPQKVTQPKSTSTKTWLLIVILALIVVVLLGFIFLNNSSKKKVGKTKKETKISTKAATQKTSTVGYVTALEGLNLRDQPSTDSNKILLLPEGTEVTILGTDNDWYYVEAQTKGYVSKDYISSTKPEKTVLKVFSNPTSPFNFLYHSIYKISFETIDPNGFEYRFTSADSYGGFSVKTEMGFTTLGNYALKNYPGAKKTACAVQFAASRKECEQLETDTGTIYLLLINTTLYKISYLKTEGGLLADINNIVFYTLFFKDQTQ